MITRQQLETAFAKAKTDKFEHGYSDAYSYIFSDFIPSTILEIGVKFGNSLVAWRDLFRSAKISGIDNDKSKISYFKNIKKLYDVSVFIGDSTSPSSYEPLPWAFYDIVIDDGSHFIEDQIKTFDIYKEYFNKFYVIEDFLSIGNLNTIINHIENAGFSKIKIFDSKLYTKYKARKKFVLKDSDSDDFIDVEVKIIVIEK